MKLKQLLSQNIILTTPLSKERALEIISKQIEIDPTFGLKRSLVNSKKPYFGIIDRDTFQIERKTSYRNKSLPRIIGTVYNDGSGTKIKLKMRLEKPVKFGIIFSLVFTVSVTFAITISKMKTGFEFKDILIYMPLALILALYCISFYAEKMRSIKDFRRFLEC
ncbi:MAG: hypothetical protein RL204_399 [Bacteroidota bacterium]|jgi:hypothetical protein